MLPATHDVMSPALGDAIPKLVEVGSDNPQYLRHQHVPHCGVIFEQLYEAFFFDSDYFALLTGAVC
jgi:hypothetical protein